MKLMNALVCVSVLGRKASLLPGKQLRSCLFCKCTKERKRGETRAKKQVKVQISPHRKNIQNLIEQQKENTQYNQTTIKPQSNHNQTTFLNKPAQKVQQSKHASLF